MAGYRTQGPNTSSESDEKANLQLSPQREIPESQAVVDGGSGLQNQLSEVRGVEGNQDPALPEKLHGESSSSAVEHEKYDVQRSPEECGQRGSLRFSQTPPDAHLVATDMTEGVKAASIKLSIVGSVLEPSAGKSAQPEPVSHSGSVVDLSSHVAECRQGDSHELPQANTEHRVATTTREGLHEAIIKLPEGSVVEPSPPKSAQSKSDSESCNVEESGPYVAECSQGLSLATTYVEHPLATAMKEEPHDVNIKRPEVVSTVDTSLLNSQSSSVKESGSQTSGCSYGNSKKSPMAVSAEHLAATREVIRAARLKLSKSGSLLETSLHKSAPLQSSTSQTVSLEDSNLQTAACSQADSQGLSNNSIDLVATAIEEGLQEASIQISETAYAENLVGTAMTEGLQEASIQISVTAYAENLGTAMTEGLQEARNQIYETAHAENLGGTAMTEGLQEARNQISETAYAENLGGTAMTEGLQEARNQISETAYAVNLVGTAMTEGLQEAIIKLSEGGPQTASCDEADSHCLSQTADEPLEVTTVRGVLKEVSITLSTIRNGLRDVSIKLFEATSMLATTFQNSLSSSVEDLASQTLDGAAGENQDSVLPEQFSGDCSSSVLEQEKCDPASSPVERTQASELGVSQAMFAEHLVSTAVREGLHEASTKLSKVGSVFESSQKSASPESASQSGSVEDLSSQAAECSQGNSHGLSEITCIEHILVPDMTGLREASATLSEAGPALEFPPSYNSSSAEDSDSQSSECSDRVSEDFSRAAYAEYLAATATRVLLEAASNKLSESYTVEPFPHISDPVESSSLSRSEDSGSHVSDCTQGDSHELSQTAYAEHLVGVAIREGLKATSIKISEVGCVVEPSQQKSSPTEISQTGSEDSSSQAAECSQGDSQGLSQMIACADLVATAMMEGLQEASTKLSETGSTVKSPLPSSHFGSVENSGLQAAEDNRGENQELSMAVYAEQVTTTTTREGLQEDIKLSDVGSVVEPSPKSASSESTSFSESTEDSRPQILSTVSHETAAEQLECDQGESPMSQTASAEHFVATATELLCVVDKLPEASPLSEIEPLALPTTPHTHSCSASEATPATEPHEAIAPQHSSGVRHAICHNSQSESDESE